MFVMTRRLPLAVVALAVVVVLAGCPAPAGPSTPPGDPNTDDPITGPPTPPEETPTDDGIGESRQVTVNGSLSVNATQIYQRVEQLMDVNASAPDVRVERMNRSSSVGLAPSPVRQALGFANTTGSVQACDAFTSAYATDGSVTISPVNPVTGENLSASTIELVLVHEYAHTLQNRVEGFRNATAAGNLHISQAMTEGSAVFVTDTYAQRHDVRWSGKRPMEVRKCVYKQTRGMRKLVNGDYYYGGQYFSQRIDEPSALSTAIETVPNTTEQLIHGETPASEPVAPLSVTVDESESFNHRDSPALVGFPTGELSLRTWLSEGLSADRVDTAATGWGNAHVATFRDGTGNVSLAWTVRWDAPGEADEFGAALADLVPTLENRTGTHLRHVRVAPETVVVFGGNQSFVADATATGTNGNVTVAVPGPKPDDGTNVPPDGNNSNLPSVGGSETTTTAADAD